MFALQGLLFLAAMGFVIFSIVNMVRAEKFRLTGMIPSVMILILVLVLNGGWGQVPAGHRGVVLRFGAVTGEEKAEGLYFITPFVNDIVLMDVQVHADKSVATAASHDLQNVSTEVTVNYRLDPTRTAEVYRDLRGDYFTRVGMPAIQEAVKASTAQFDAEQLITQRPQVKDAIEKYLQHRLVQHGMIVDGISLTDFKFSADFTNAIEQKVTATQLAMAAENKLRQVNAEAQQTISIARAEAEAIRIQASAINAQGGRDYVQLQAISKWNGALPVWVAGGNATPFINMTPPGR